VYGLKHQKEKRSMDDFAGLDVSVKETTLASKIFFIPHPTHAQSLSRQKGMTGKSMRFRRQFWQCVALMPHYREQQRLSIETRFSYLCASVASDSRMVSPVEGARCLPLARYRG
jgi:hypothetical protein